MTDANVQELHHSHDEDVRLVRKDALTMIADFIAEVGQGFPDDGTRLLAIARAQGAAMRLHILLDALVAEHEAADYYLAMKDDTWSGMEYLAEFDAAHDNAERVMNS